MADYVNTGLVCNYNLNLRNLLSKILIDGRKTVNCVNPQNESIFNNVLAEICSEHSISLADIKFIESLPPLRAKLYHLHKANEKARLVGGSSWLRFWENSKHEVYIWPVTFKSSVLL